MTNQDASGGPPSDRCPGLELLEAFVLGPPPGDARDEALRVHLQSCDACRARADDVRKANEFLDAFRLDGPTNADECDYGWRDGPGVVERPGMTVGRYKLLQEIGEGGFGVVFMAEQVEPVSRRVAVKILKAGMDTRQVLGRFEAERQALAMMDHPNIARVLDAGTTETGRPFFVMELVRGVSITRYCDDLKRTLAERLQLFCQVCAAVQHAHQKGIIHRDLKPSNVLVTRQDDAPMVKVIDFGIAKATGPRLTERTLFTRYGQFMGTPQYMSPEQADLTGLDVDTRSDVYSLGVILYELLTGVTPLDPQALRGKDQAAVQRLIRDGVSQRPSTRIATIETSATVAASRGLDPRSLGLLLRGDLDWILLKALEKERTRRYGSASDLAADIGRYLRSEPVEASPPGTVYRCRKFIRRHRTAAVSAALVAMMLVAGIIGTASGMVWALRERDVAAQRATERDSVVRFLGEDLWGMDAEHFGAALRTGVLGHTRAALERASMESAAVDRAMLDLESRLAEVNFTDVGLDALHLSLIGPSIEAIERDFAAQPLLQAQLLQSIVPTIVAVGGPGMARAPLQQALDIRTRLLGDEHAETLDTMSHMASLLTVLGQLDEAEELSRSTLEGRRRTLGPNDPATLKSISDLGNLLRIAKKFDAAKPYLVQALERRRQVLGPDDPDTIVSIASLGDLYRDQGKLPDAEKYLRDALERRRRVLGDEDRDTLDSLNGLGALYLHQDRVSEANALFVEAVGIARRTLGSSHARTLGLINNLATVLARQGRPQEAVPYLREALASCREELGVDHRSTLSVMSNLGVTLHDSGQLDEAASVLAEAVSLRRRVLGELDPDTLTTIGRLGAVRADQGRLEEAEVLCTEAVVGLGRMSSPQMTGPRAAARATLGAVLMARGQVAEAEQSLREALVGFSAYPTHPRALQATITLSKLLNDTGRDAEALTLLRTIEAPAHNLWSGTNPAWLGAWLCEYGEALRSAGDRAAAETALREAYPLLVEAWGGHDQRTVRCVERLCTLYDDLAIAAPGPEWESRAAEWRERLNREHE